MAKSHIKSTFLIVPVLVGSLISLFSLPAWSQDMDHQSMEDHAQHTMSATSTANTEPSAATPSLPGQDAFGAIQEIVEILESDPTTDWSLVNISGLRNHLVDMNQLVMLSTVKSERIDGGLRMVVTGTGPAVASIHTMVSAHAPMIDGLDGWTVSVKKIPAGAIMVATAQDPHQTARIRGLGFFGLMVSDSHHQSHHLGLAMGQNPHGN